MVVDDNGKQQERASDDEAARQHSSKINEIGCDKYLPVFCCCVRTRIQFFFGLTRDSAKDQ